MSPLTDAPAACRRSDIDPDALYVTGRAQHQAARICHACPIRLPCLREALENREEHGVWGGMTARQRRQLLHQHPTDWDEVVTAATRT